MSETEREEHEEREEVDTSVSTLALLQLFRDRANAALDGDKKPEYELENIRDVCDNIIERNE